LNNLFLVTATATVLTGTLYPLLMQALHAESITVGPPYFNATIVPLLMPMIFLMGIGPFLAWKTADLRGVAQRLKMAAIITIVIALAALSMKLPHPGMAIAGIGLSAWLVTATLAEWAEHAGKRKISWARIRGMKAGQWSLTLAHIGLGVAILGMTGTALLKKENMAVMKAGDKIPLGGYELTLQNVLPAFGKNYNAMRADIAVTGNGEKFSLHPERRIYPAAGKGTVEAGIRTSWHDDVYVALGNYDEKADTWVIHAWSHPLVPFLWGGFALMALGGFIGLWEKRRA
ncbi:MAG TPA: cytochrome c-type biogenesis CcmF C-terminal domain-containing protein, partial [Alphaproteobacteria bacterium]